jgi:hypothetical protein
MVKATKFFRKQAQKAERSAAGVKGSEASEQLRNLADAFRAQAEVLKQKSKKPKKTKAAT